MSHPDIEDVLPVTPLQEGLYFEWLYRDGEEDSYVLQDTLEFKGPLDIDRLRNAAKAVFIRHPALRAGFWMRPTTGQLLQVVAATAEPVLTAVDLTGVETSRGGTELRTLLSDEMRLGHDLGKPPLLRCVVVRLAAEHHVLVLTYHHILLDGWSVALLLEQIIEGYDQSLTPAGTPATPNPYRVYGEWLASQDRGPAEAAWRDYLSGVDAGRRVAPGKAGNMLLEARHLTGRTDRETIERLRAYARANSLTLNTLVQTAWGLLLGRLCGSDDVVIGKTVAGRPAELPGSEHMIGSFANTVPARIRLDPAETVEQLCVRLQREQSRLARYEYMGLGAIQRLCGQRELCDTGFAFQNLPRMTRQPRVGDGALQITIAGDNTPPYPLALTALLDGEELITRLTYAGSLFDEAVMEKVASALPPLLGRIADEPHTRVGEVEGTEAALLFRSEDRPAAGRRDDGAELPEAEVARALIGLLSEILGVPEARLGLHDDFFDLGGGSLQAAHLSIQVRRILGRELSVRQILDHPEIGDMARACAGAHSEQG